MKEIIWKLHLNSSPKRVFKYLNTAKGRASFWAESAEYRNGIIYFKFANGMEYQSKVKSSVPNQLFELEYFNTLVKFELLDDQNGGTDLILTNSNITQDEYIDMYAGWLSVLYALKGACDHSIDLRNHDQNRTWDQGYVDN